MNIEHLINPPARLAQLRCAKAQHVVTCTSDTCSHASHDDSYTAVDLSGASPEVQRYVRRNYRQTRGNVHSHGRVVRTFEPAPGRATSTMRSGDVVDAVRYVMSLRRLSEAEKGEFAARMVAEHRYLDRCGIGIEAEELAESRRAAIESAARQREAFVSAARDAVRRHAREGGFPTLAEALSTAGV